MPVIMLEVCFNLPLGDCHGICSLLFGSEPLKVPRKIEGLKELGIGAVACGKTHSNFYSALAPRPKTARPFAADASPETIIAVVGEDVP